MTTAYSRIDRFLRKNLNDDDYPAYKEELDALCQAKLQRTWVDLTQHELDELDEQSPSLHDFVQNLMSKLKEKNT